jgi:hypothetical protein
VTHYKSHEEWKDILKAILQHALSKNPIYEFDDRIDLLKIWVLLHKTSRGITPDTSKSFIDQVKNLKELIVVSVTVARHTHKKAPRFNRGAFCY